MSINYYKKLRKRLQLLIKDYTPDNVSDYSDSKLAKLVTALVAVEKLISWKSGDKEWEPVIKGLGE